VGALQRDAASVEGLSGRFDLAITRYIEAATGWSIKRFVRTARRYRTIQIQVGKHTVTAEDPLPADLHNALAQIN
jgi:hypothetical protein